MNKIRLRYVGVLTLIIAFVGVSAANATLTLNATSITSDGNVTINGITSSVYAIGAATTDGTITIGGTAQTGNLIVGSSSGINGILIGNGAGVTTVSIAHTGTAGNTVNIAGAANLDTTTDTVNVATGNSVGGTSGGKTVNIATGTPGASAANTVNIASGATTTGTAVVTIGSSGAAAHTTLIQGGNGATAIRIIPAAAGAVIIGGTSQAGTITIGQSTAASTISIGSATNGAAQSVNVANGTSGADATVNILSGIATAGTQTLNILSGASTSTGQAVNIMAGGAGSGTRVISIGTGAVATTATIGNAVGASTVSIVAGTGEITLAGGVRRTGRQTVNKSVAPVDIADTAATPTVAQILDAGIFTSLPTADHNFTLPTAATASGLVQGLPGTPAVGDVFTFVINNNAALASGFQNVITAGTGATIVGTPNVEPGFTRTVYCRVTAVTADNETISCY